MGETIIISDPNFLRDNIPIWIVLFLFFLYSVWQIMYCRGIYCYQIKKVDYVNDVTEKTIIVTGANSGAGMETVIRLAKLNAKNIIMACRNEKKALAAMIVIKQAVPDTKSNIDYINLDLMDTKSIKSFADKVKAKYPIIDILLNNAGMFNSKLEYTEHGIETNFAADHLGPFYLTDLLMDNIKKSKEGRIIIAASIIHEMLQGEIDIDAVFDEELTSIKFGAGFIQYAKAKVCQMYFTKLLAKRLQDQNVTNVKAVCLHPGVVNSRFMEAMFDRFPIYGFRCFFFCTVGIPYLWVSQICFKTNKQGSYTNLACCLMDFKKLESGAYYSDNFPKKPILKEVWLPDAEKLWVRTEALIKKIVK